MDKANFYPRPPCGGRPQMRLHGGGRAGISIHVPLAGDDLYGYIIELQQGRFLSTSPLRGTTRTPCAMASNIWSFLSTSPLRGTTREQIEKYRTAKDFYPRPPCGGRRYYSGRQNQVEIISIHVPLAGDDPAVFWMSMAASTFLSTSPLRGTTAGGRGSQTH